MSNVRRRSVHKRPSAIKSPSVINTRANENDDHDFDKPVYDGGPKSPKGGKGKSRKHSGDEEFGNGFDSVELDGYRTRMVNVSLKPLPAITKDRDVKKRVRNLLAKLQQCHVIIDFDKVAPQPRNRDAFNSAKQVKRNALNECVNFVSSTKDIIDTEVFKAIIAVVAKNCFRAFAQPEDPFAAPNDPEDDEPLLEGAWPHLQLVYALFLKSLEHKSLTAKMFQDVTGPSFIPAFVALFASCDPRERDSVKSCVHRMYGRFMPIRAAVRAEMRHLFVRVAYDTNAPPYHGIPELLEFYGCIVNGFVAPLKEEHKDMLLIGIMPLHRCKVVSTYHRQLVFCVTQFLSKSPDLVHKVLPWLLKHWPKGYAPKEVLFVSELEAIMRSVSAEEHDAIFPTICRRIAKCTESVHFMVAERSLAFFNNQMFLASVRRNAEEIFPILVPALHRNTKRHWSGSIHDHNDNAVDTMNDIDPDLYQQCSSEKVVSHEKAFKAQRVATESKWDAILQLAKKNPLAGTVVPLINNKLPIATPTPHVYMKGETTSPHRQHRMHKATAHHDDDGPDAHDGAASEGEEEDEGEAETEDDVSDDDDDAASNEGRNAGSPRVVPVADNPRLVRRRSLIMTPQHDTVAKELSEFHKHALNGVPVSPLGSGANSPDDASDNDDDDTGAAEDEADEADVDEHFNQAVDSDDDDPDSGYLMIDTVSIKAKAAARGLIGGGTPPKIAPVEHESYSAEQARLQRVTSDPNALSPVALPTHLARTPLGMLEGAWMVKRSAGTFKKSNRRWFTVDVPNSRIAYYVISPAEKPGGLGLTEEDVRGVIAFSDIRLIERNNRQLIVDSSHKKFTLTAATKTVANAWCDALIHGMKQLGATTSPRMSTTSLSAMSVGTPTALGVSLPASPVTPSPTKGKKDTRKSRRERKKRDSASKVSQSPAHDVAFVDLQADAPGDGADSPGKGRDSASPIESYTGFDGPTPASGAEGAPDGTAPAWLVDNMSKADCDAVVGKQAEGDFVVRRAGDAKYEVCVCTGGGSTVHLPVKVTATGTYALGTTHQASSLETLIEELQRRPPTNKKGQPIVLREAAIVGGGIDRSKRDRGSITSVTSIEYGFGSDDIDGTDEDENAADGSEGKDDDWDLEA
eukprot:m.918189 g.918189  ORF g.918189 m.918189 type:complete len:1137 (-) comp23741_c0_seq2:252-3662(-)